MSDTVKLNPCPKCGAPIPADAPQGLCPKCVLLGAATGTEGGGSATATSEIPSMERVAAAFPQLEIIELIGRGGMGFVFKARQPHLDRFVALKLLPDKLAGDPRFAERFNREGRVLARLNHANIVSVYDFGKTEHFYFLLMEFVDGVNLRQAMQAGRFSPGEALAIVPKICEALQYAHSHGILHRDIKPENILLDGRGEVKIADFGIAKLVGEEKADVTLTGTGAAIGTVHYMAPEQLEKPSEVDHRADIYSLGVVFYEMLTGELPIGRFAAPSSKTPVGANVDEVVFRTLEKDRERRYQSAGEMKQQVEHLTDESQAARAAPPMIGSANAAEPKWSQKAIWAAVLTTLSLPLSLPMLIVMYQSAGSPTWFALAYSFGVIAFPALAGCILGWVALSDIRAHRGRLRGVPLAVFAALAWPVFILVGVTLVAPWLIASRPSTGTPRPLIGLLVLMVPVGTITFAIWAIYSTARWGTNQPISRRRGVLKWMFAALLLAGIGLLFAATFIRKPRPRQAQEVSVQMQAAALAATDPNGPRASEENWAPELAPGEKPDPQKILDEARELTGQLRYEEALQRHIWYHNHALEYRPSQVGVRLSFALSYWMELARRYPKAKQALLEIRDRGATEFDKGGGSFALFMEVSGINRELGDQNATVALFKSIRSLDLTLARKCYQPTEDLLVEKGEYALCASFIPNFQDRFENIRAVRERTLAVADRTPEANQGLMRMQTQRTFIKETRKLIEILVGIGRKAEAEQIRDQAVAIVDVVELRYAVTDVEQNVAKHSPIAEP